MGITYQHGFDPQAQYRVATWRGFDYGTRKFQHNEIVTVADIPAPTLFTLLRFHGVEKLSVPPQPQAPGGGKPSSSAPSPSPRARVSAMLEGLSLKQLRQICEEKKLDPNGDKDQLRDRILSVVG